MKGTLANMMIEDYAVEDAVVIPLHLIQQEVGGKDFVFLLSEESGVFALL